MDKIKVVHISAVAFYFKLFFYKVIYPVRIKYGGHLRNLRTKPQRLIPESVYEVHCQIDNIGIVTEYPGIFFKDRPVLYGIKITVKIRCQDIPFIGSMLPKVAPQVNL